MTRVWVSAWKSGSASATSSTTWWPPSGSPTCSSTSTRWLFKIAWIGTWTRKLQPFLTSELRLLPQWSQHGLSVTLICALLIVLAIISYFKKIRRNIGKKDWTHIFYQEVTLLTTVPPFIAFMPPVSGKQNKRKFHAYLLGSKVWQHLCGSHPVYRTNCWRHLDSVRRLLLRRRRQLPVVQPLRTSQGLAHLRNCLPRSDLPLHFPQVRWLWGQLTGTSP